MPDLPGIVPDWPAPRKVRAFQTVRGTGPLDSLETTLSLPAPPSWLDQVHGATVAFPGPGEHGLAADAGVGMSPGIVLAVKTADCLPVLFCDRAGTRIGAAHAGWRGLAAGVLEAVITGLDVPPAELLAWFGPAIGQDAFEVGPEVRAAYVARCADDGEAFVRGRADRWHADLEALARSRLERAGLDDIYGGGWCTASDVENFFSYRRDGGAGRMATLIWIEM